MNVINIINSTNGINGTNSTNGIKSIGCKSFVGKRKVPKEATK